MGSLISWMDKTFYPNFGDNWDNKMFREIILQHINANTVCLDYGAGSGILEEMNFKDKVKHIAGVDPDDAILRNNFLHEKHVVNLNDFHLPFPDNHFDLIFSCNVLEHIDAPEAVMTEIIRVLKPGGDFLIKTPNKYHYVARIASITPEWFHKFYNTLRGRNEADTFPTLYRLNTTSAIRQIANDAHMELRELKVIEGRPEYLRLSPITYAFGTLYEKIVNSASIFEPLRCVLFVHMIKPKK